MEKAFKYRIYPNKNQKELIQKTFGCTRYVYNYFLNLRKSEYEKNNKSLAYISSNEKGPFIYYMGGVNGGTSKAYIKMIETLAFNIREDYKNGIIARVHDESHINRYFKNHPCKILPKEYCIPEELVTDNIQPRMIFRNKITFDLSFNKGRKTNLYLKCKRFLDKMICLLKWYL